MQAEWSGMEIDAAAPPVMDCLKMERKTRKENGAGITVLNRTRGENGLLAEKAKSAVRVHPVRRFFSAQESCPVLLPDSLALQGSNLGDRFFLRRGCRKLHRGREPVERLLLRRCRLHGLHGMMEMF